MKKELSLVGSILLRVEMVIEVKSDSDADTAGFGKTDGMFLLRNMPGLESQITMESQDAMDGAYGTDIDRGQQI